MAKNTTTVDFIFDKGLHTETDPKLQLDNSLLDLQNGLFDKLGAINKRKGFTSLTRTRYGALIGGTGTIFSGKALATSDNELGLFDGNFFYGYSPTANTWVSRGQITSVIPTNYEVVSNDYQQTCHDVAYADGIEVHVWTDSRNANGGSGFTDVYCSVIDSETRTKIHDDILVKVQAMSARVFSFGDYFIIIYQDQANSDLSYKTLTKANLFAGLSNEVDIETSSGSFGTPRRYIWDAEVSRDGSKLWVAYPTGSTIAVRYLDTALTVSTAQTITSATPSYSGCISMKVDWMGKPWIFWHETGGGGVFNVYYAIRSATNTEVLGRTLFGTTNGGYRLVAEVDAFGTACQLFVEDNIYQAPDGYLTDSHHRCVKVWQATSSGTIWDNTTVYKRGVGLASKCFQYNSTYLVLARETDAQATYYVFDITYGVVVGRLLAGNAGGLEFLNYLPSVPYIGNGKFLFPNSVKQSAQAITGVFFSLLGANVTRLDFEHGNAYHSAYLGENLLVAGGQVSSYDGANIVEAGFHWYPEKITATQSNTANGAIANGTYRYKAVFEATDNKGNPHRSTDSLPVSITTTGSNDTVTLKIPTLGLTQRGIVKIDVYRTEAGGSIYYKLTGIGDELYNNPSVGYVEYVDEYSDSEIIGNQPLYTMGAIYNSAPPPAQIVKVWKNRAWLAGLEDPHSLWFSKLATPGLPVEFNDSYTVRTNPNGGKIMDLASLGQFLIIFKESAIYALYGNGPNNQGGVSDYGDLQVISMDVGAKFTGCAVEVPSGVMFVSNKGIYLIDRNGTPSPVGKPVEAYNNLNYVAATTIPDKNLAVFSTSDGYFIVYDWLYDQWSRWTGLDDCVDAIVHDGSLKYLTDNGYVKEYGSENYTDDGTPYSLLVETGNFAPMQRGGYSQLHAVTVFGDYKADHDLVVELHRNYTSGEPRTLTVDVAGVRAAGDTDYEFVWDKMGEKIKAFRLKIYDTNPVGESMSLSGLRLEVAQLPGANRVGENRKR